MCAVRISIPGSMMSTAAQHVAATAGLRQALAAPGAPPATAPPAPAAAAPRGRVFRPVRWAMPLESAGVPRARAVAPVCPALPPGQPFPDTLTLEAPDDPARVFFVPRYRVAVRRAGGVDHYAAALERSGGEWRFTVRLQAYAAPGLGEAAPQARPLNEPYPVSLSWTENGVVRRQVFQDVVVEEDGLRAVLTVRGLPAQDDLLRALTDPHAAARLTVARRLSMAPAAPGVSAAALLDQEVERFAKHVRPVVLVRWPGAHLAYEADGTVKIVPGLPGSGSETVWLLEDRVGSYRDGGARKASLLHTRDGRRTLTAVGPDRAELAPRTRVPLREQHVSIRRVPGSPGKARHVGLYAPWLPDSAPADGDDPWFPGFRGQRFMVVDVHRGSWALDDARVEELRRQVDEEVREFGMRYLPPVAVELPWTVEPEPFAFDERRHAYVYAGVPAAGAPALLRRQVAGSSYYQDERDPARFYYLPDRYELEVLSGPPVRPGLSVRATADPDAFLVEYAAVPVVDPARLERDGQRLLQLAREEVGEAVAAVDLEPLQGDAPQVTLSVPRAGEADGRAWLPRPGALANLQARLADSFTVSADELQELFAALHSGVSPLFTGTVVVAPGGGEKEEVPLRVRAEGDPAAVWEAVFDRALPGRRMREVQVSATHLFAGGDVREVSVAFERGGEVLLTPEQPRATVRIPLGLDDFVLRRDEADDYRYRATAVHGDGTIGTGEWTTARAAVLRPVVSA
jgi:hypothetical protein